MITCKELKEERKNLLKSKKEKLEKQFLRWEKIIDKWLNKHPNGGKYYFYLWDIPSDELRDLIVDKYSACGWYVRNFSNYDGYDRHLTFWTYDE